MFLILFLPFESSTDVWPVKIKRLNQKNSYERFTALCIRWNRFNDSKLSRNGWNITALKKLRPYAIDKREVITLMSQSGLLGSAEPHEAQVNLADALEKDSNFSGSSNKLGALLSGGGRPL
jgi:hypothetical protein